MRDLNILLIQTNYAEFRKKHRDWKRKSEQRKKKQDGQKKSKSQSTITVLLLGRTSIMNANEIMNADEIMPIIMHIMRMNYEANE